MNPSIKHFQVQIKGLFFHKDVKTLKRCYEIFKCRVTALLYHLFWNVKTVQFFLNLRRWEGNVTRLDRYHSFKSSFSTNTTPAPSSLLWSVHTKRQAFVRIIASTLYVIKKNSRRIWCESTVTHEETGHIVRSVLPSVIYLFFCHSTCRESYLISSQLAQMAHIGSAGFRTVHTVSRDWRWWRLFTGGIRDGEDCSLVQCGLAGWMMQVQEIPLKLLNWSKAVKIIVHADKNDNTTPDLFLNVQLWAVFLQRVNA